MLQYGFWIQFQFQIANLDFCFSLQSNIYFYTIKAILPNQELLVWYCKEFATRLNYPLTGEQMLLKIRECYCVGGGNVDLYMLQILNILEHL